MSNIKTYIDEQIEIENKYHQKLIVILAMLEDGLFNYLEKGYPSIIGLYNTNDALKDKIMPSIHNANMSCARDIVNLSEDTIGNKLSISTKQQQISNVGIGLNVKVKNILNIYYSRIIDLIPVTAGILPGYNLFNDENTKSEITKRNEKSLDLFVTENVSTATVNSLFTQAKIMGYTEYLPNNQHDKIVRETHKKYFNGIDWIKIDKPPVETGHVGTQYNCRCYVEAFR